MTGIADDVKQRIKTRLRALGLRQNDLATFLDVDPSNVSRMLKPGRRIDVDELTKIEQFFAKHQDGDNPSMTGDLGEAAFEHFGATHAPPSGGDVPLFTADNSMRLRLDRLGRAGSIGAHPAQAGARGAFAAYIVDDLNVPRYVEGEIVYAVTGRPPQIGKPCIVQYVDDTAEVAIYEGAVAGAIRVRAVSEKQARAIPRDRVKGVHAIVGAWS